MYQFDDYFKKKKFFCFEWHRNCIDCHSNYHLWYCRCCHRLALKFLKITSVYMIFHSGLKYDWEKSCIVWLNFFKKNLFNGAALMRQVCGVEKTWINAANVVAQTSICCTFFPVISPYVILWHFTFEKPLHPKYFFMIRKNIIYLLTIWQHAAVLVLNLFWYKIQGLVCNDSNDDRGRGSVTIFQKSKYLQTITVKNWGVLLLKKMFIPISWHCKIWLGI